MKRIIYLLLALTFALVSCNDDNGGRRLQREDITLQMPQEGWVAEINKPFVIHVTCNIAEGITFRWFLDDQYISNEKDLVYTFKRTGNQHLKLMAIQGKSFFEYGVIVDVKGKETPDGNQSPYITKVLDYLPAPSPYTNKYPPYYYGDTPMDMNNKVLAAIGNGNMGVITLGGYGGYVVVGFDHTIENKPGKRDFRILGNVLDTYDNAAASDINRGGAEPGIIMVAYDSNKNGRPDDDEWCEIVGSAHHHFEDEPWYDLAVTARNDLKTIKNYAITYFVPEKEPEQEDDWNTYLRWEDNQGRTGYIAKNGYYSQSYYPQWVLKDQLTFTGTRLPQNAIDNSGTGEVFYGYSFAFGYADNQKNEDPRATIDIDWAVDSNGRKAQLPGVDFIKIYTGVHQRYGRLGGCSTEITGIEDLHLLGEDIDTY